MIDFRTIHTQLSGYEALYRETLLPQLDAMEERRKKVLKLAFGFGCVAVFAAIAAGRYALTLSFVDGDVSLSFYIALGVAAIILAYPFFLIRGVKDDKKLTIISSITQYLGWTFSAKINNEPNLQAFRKNGLLPSYTSSAFEDFFKGHYKGADFEFYELHLKQQSGKNSHTVFRGLILTMDPHRQFEGRTVVLRDKKFFQFNKKNGMKRVGLVDPVFEKIFEAYSTDQVESRYLLTPDFMQRLVDLETAAHGHKIRFGFLDGKLYVALGTGNRFEAGSIFTRMDDPAPVENTLREISALLRLMDGILDEQNLS